MKKVLLFFTLVISTFIHAQDVIIKTDGSEIKSVVTEITDIVIKYKTWDYQTGPVYSIPLKEVFEIKYSNGTKYFVGLKSVDINKSESKETDKNYEQKNVIKTVNNYFLYDSLMKDSKNYNEAGILCWVAGPVFIVSGSILLAVSINQSNSITTVLSCVMLVGGTALTILAPFEIAKSKQLSNDAQKYKPSAYLSIPSPIFMAQNQYKGIGISLSLTF